MMKLIRHSVIVACLFVLAACQSESYEARFMALNSVPPKIAAQSCDTEIGQLAQQADDNIPYLLQQLLNTSETDHFAGRILFRRGDFADYVLSTRFGELETYGLDPSREARVEAFYDDADDALIMVFQKRQQQWKSVTQGGHGALRRVDCYER